MLRHDENGRQYTASQYCPFCPRSFELAETEEGEKHVFTVHKDEPSVQRYLNEQPTKQDNPQSTRSPSDADIALQHPYSAKAGQSARVNIQPLA